MPMGDDTLRVQSQAGEVNDMAIDNVNSYFVVSI